MSRLIRIDNGIKRPRGAVVFVHGLNGDPFNTWNAGLPGTPSWPNWLAEDLKHVEVWTTEYDAAALEWQGHAMRLPLRARNFLSLLAAEGLEGRRLIFVTHSLGGLVVKQALRSSSDQPEAPGAKILSTTRGVFF
jgi:hypothetical protein